MDKQPVTIKLVYETLRHFTYKQLISQDICLYAACLEKSLME